MKHWDLNKKNCLAVALSGALALGLLAGCGSVREAAAASESATIGSTANAPSVTEATANAPTVEQTAPASSAAAAESPAVVAVSAIASEQPEGVAVQRNGATEIGFTGGGATVSGEGAVWADGVLLISAGGTYRLSGTLDDGRVVVDAKGEDVALILDGADITCSYGSPLYVYKAERVVLHLEENSENTLTDGSGYTYSDKWSSAADEEPNACLYSKADLLIQSGFEGSLTVNANYNN